MPLLSLMASTHSTCPPGLVLPPISRNLKDFPQHLRSKGLRQELIRSSILSLTPHEQDDLREFYEYNHFARASPIRNLPFNGDTQDKQAELLQFLMSESNKLEKDYLDPSMFQELVRIRAAKADMHLLHLAGTDFDSSNVSGLNTPLRHPSGSYYYLEPNSDLVHDLVSPVVSDGGLPSIGGLSDMKDLVAVVEEFKLRNDSAWRKEVLVPTFRWTDTIGLQDQNYLPSLTVDYLTAAPLKRLEKVKRKQSSKRKGKRRVGDRESYKNNSFQACEMLLSLMMDKKRNFKSVMNSVKKAGPALPLLLTQLSASITGTGLAVMFSVIYKVACGSVPFCTSNLLVSGFGIGLFWLSWAVNKLKDTVTYMGKKSTRLEYEEEMMMKRVDKSVNDILFCAASLMGVFMLRFA